MSSSSGPRAATVSTGPRPRSHDAALLVAGERPAMGVGLLGLVVLAALLFLARRRLARLQMGEILVAGMLSLPLLALLGPSFALPSVPQLFAFRVALVLVGLVGATYLIVRPVPLAFAAGDVALPLALWFAWLSIGLLWAPDKLEAVTYIAIVATMLALVVATAAAGSTRRRLVWFGVSMVAGYLVIAGFTVLEARFGVRLPTSRLLDAATSQAYAVTSVFHNQNDLATYIALCWPFMLCAFFFTRRPLLLLLSAACIVLGAAAFVRTGSRSSLIAVGVSSLAAVVLLSHFGARLSTRTGKAVGALVVLVLIGGAAYLLFNDSDSDMLRQFRLESLVSQSAAGTGSGAIRTSLTSRALEIAGDTFLIGAGPGQAEGIVSSGVDGLGISNLHNWWLESYVNGGLVGFALHFVFYLGLLVTLWPVARRDPDPLVRYLASGTVLALLGFTIGALGPSSSVSFAPMWIAYGLGLAVVSRSRLAASARGARVPAAPVDGESAVRPGGEA
jgi:teichuronic acid biosynthesis protein TuaE